MLMQHVKPRIYLLSFGVLLVSLGGFIGVILGVTTHPVSHADVCVGSSADGSMNCGGNNPQPTNPPATQAPAPTTAPVEVAPQADPTVVPTSAPSTSTQSTQSSPPPPCHS